MAVARAAVALALVEAVQVMAVVEAAEVASGSEACVVSSRMMRHCLALSCTKTKDAASHAQPGEP